MLRKENLHHAHLLEGRREPILEKLHDFFTQELLFAIHGSPDYWQKEFDSIGIDDARAISSMQQRRAAAGGKKYL